MAEEKGRVVVRKKRSYGEAHHGGSWKIAYSDFMTSMMSFFLVMWLISLVPKQDLQAIAQYFKMPLATAIQGGPKISPSKSVIPGGDPSPIPNQFPIGMPSSAQSEDDQRLENLKEDLNNLIENNPTLKQYRPQLLLDMTPDGLRIQIIDQENRPMFATASDRVASYMREILRAIAEPINQLPNRITVSGHTDAHQYASGNRYYSNWELSSDRANSARRELVAGGLDSAKVKRILGLSDTNNLVKDDPMAAVNRRISILVLNKAAEARIDAQNAAGNEQKLDQILSGEQAQQPDHETPDTGLVEDPLEDAPNATPAPQDGPEQSGLDGAEIQAEDGGAAPGLVGQTQD